MASVAGVGTVVEKTTPHQAHVTVLQVHSIGVLILKAGRDVLEFWVGVAVGTGVAAVIVRVVHIYVPPYVATPCAQFRQAGDFHAKGFRLVVVRACCHDVSLKTLATCDLT